MTTTPKTTPTPSRSGAEPAMSAPRLPALPAIVSGTVVHRRRRPFHHGFHHGVYLWLVDLDAVPRLPWYLRLLASFSPRDHLDCAGDRDPRRIKDSLAKFLAAHGEKVEGRVLMLAGARVLGHVFDPLTVYWCLRPDGGVRCIVAEVHNTYGERHAYLLHPDRHGSARVHKQFYVSPFNDVAGDYLLRFALTERRVGIRVSLARDGQRIFDAGFSGVPEPATAAAVLRSVLRRPAMPQRVSALIRLHGIALWLRGLPVVPKPEHQPQEGL